MREMYLFIAKKIGVVYIRAHHSVFFYHYSRYFTLSITKVMHAYITNASNSSERIQISVVYPLKITFNHSVV